MKYVKCILVCASLIVLVATSMSGADLCQNCRGDANGDKSVNILDVQKVVSQVLHGPDGAASADVNGDGTVDIRDFQYVLHQAEKAGTEDNAEPVDDGRNQATVGSPCRLCAKYRTPTHFIIDADEDSETPDFRSVDFPVVSFRARTERYLFRLTPHAPPSCA